MRLLILVFHDDTSYRNLCGRSRYDALLLHDTYRLRGIFETRAKNAPSYSNAVSYMSPTGIFSNMAGTDGMPASSGYTHRGAIVGLGFANVPASTWAVNVVDTIVAGVYGRASNSGTAPAFGGFFYDLFAGGLIFGRKCITGTSNNTWYLNREDTFRLLLKRDRLYL